MIHTWFRTSLLAARLTTYILSIILATTLAGGAVAFYGNGLIDMGFAPLGLLFHEEPMRAEVQVVAATYSPPLPSSAPVLPSNPGPSSLFNSAFASTPSVSHTSVMPVLDARLWSPPLIVEVLTLFGTGVLIINILFLVGALHCVLAHKLSNALQAATERRRMAERRKNLLALASSYAAEIAEEDACYGRCTAAEFAECIEAGSLVSSRSGEKYTAIFAASLGLLPVLPPRSERRGKAPVVPPLPEQQGPALPTTPPRPSRQGVTLGPFLGQAHGRTAVASRCVGKGKPMHRRDAIAEEF